MPPISRERKLADIRLSLKSVVLDVQKASTVGNLEAFKAAGKGVQPVINRLIGLEEDTRIASHGYLSNPRARRALDIASRDLDALAVVLQEWMEFAELADSAMEMAKLALKLGAHSIEMGRISFAPDLPRPKPTRDELAIIERAESASHTERAYHLPVPTAKEILDGLGQHDRYAKTNTSGMKPLTGPVNEERMKPVNPDEEAGLRSILGD